MRPLSGRDENEIYLIRSDERVLQYTDMVKAETINDAREFIKKINSGIGESKCLF